MHGKSKVLLIDSGKALAEAAHEAAEAAGWDLSVAIEKADAALKAVTEEPEVIVLGYLDPQGEAFRLHKRLKANPNTADIPQVVVDVAPEEQAAHGWRKGEGLVMEAEEYVCQPVNASALVRIVGGILARTRVSDTV